MLNDLGIDRGPESGAGCAEANERFEELVAPHLPAMHRKAVAMLRSDDLAWDAVQEALIRAWNQPALGTAPRRILIALVHLSCLHSLRCARRRQHHEELSQEHQGGHCCDMDPAHEVEARDLLAAITRATALLTAEHRDVLALVSTPGRTYRDAAQELGVPVGTVRSRASRARVELRRLMDVALGSPDGGSHSGERLSPC